MSNEPFLNSFSHHIRSAQCRDKLDNVLRTCHMSRPSLNDSDRHLSLTNSGISHADTAHSWLALRSRMLRPNHCAVNQLLIETMVSFVRHEIVQDMFRSPHIDLLTVDICLPQYSRPSFYHPMVHLTPISLAPSMQCSSSISFSFDARRHLSYSPSVST
jgi:hypothetical protein